MASNDGYLLQHLVARRIRVLGIEPAANVAAWPSGGAYRPAWRSSASRRASEVREEHGPADLVVANNVFAHVPDMRRLRRGLAALLADDGVVSMEVPHLMRLVERSQYDTIYHEHF